MQSFSFKVAMRPINVEDIVRWGVWLGRLPCYDLTPVTSFTLGSSLRLPTLGTPDSHGLTGGVCKVRERIHRIIADIRLLANPASCRRVAACNLN